MPASSPARLPVMWRLCRWTMILRVCDRANPRRPSRWRVRPRWWCPGRCRCAARPARTGGCQGLVHVAQEVPEQARLACVARGEVVGEWCQLSGRRPVQVVKGRPMSAPCSDSALRPARRCHGAVVVGAQGRRAGQGRDRVGTHTHGVSSRRVRMTSGGSTIWPPSRDVGASIVRPRTASSPAALVT